VASRAYPVEQSKDNRFIRTFNKRILLFVLIYSIQLLYVPTSERVSGGLEPKLPIDIFPIWAIWVIPYVLCYVLWLCSVIWIVLNADDPYVSFLPGCLRFHLYIWSPDICFLSYLCKASHATRE
jgi:hypothetical protein